MSHGHARSVTDVTPEGTLAIVALAPAPSPGAACTSKVASGEQPSGYGFPMIASAAST